MKPEVIPTAGSAAEVDQFWREWNEGWRESEDGDPSSGKEFWFDYISDTGDSQRAVYSVAYLCLSDFVVGKDPQPGDEPEFIMRPDPPRLDAGGRMLLPRGTFLCVGGDTGYHIADYGTLAERFQNPFWWAYDDLSAAGASSVANEVPRLLFGIPGNHDYYDSLDGFNRQFRRPSTGDESAGGQRAPQLMIPTFRREQEASFLALRLPFDWWFWGLDTEEGEIDYRQLQFFKGIQKRHAPRRLIVATPEPSTVFGKFAKAEENQSKTFKELGLERPFLKEPEPLGAGKCRLDLAGDVHHYARHWGQPPGAAEAADYTSVMAGGGGAFFHPSHTDVGEVPQQALYPRAAVSRRTVADEIFKFRNIWGGGWVWLFGFVIAFSLFFAANFPQSSKDAFDSFPPWIKLGISPPASAQSPQPSVAYVKPMPRYTFGPNALPTPPQYLLWSLALAASVVAVGAALGYSMKLFRREYDPAGTAPLKTVTRRQRYTVWILVLAGFALLMYGLLGFHTWEANLTRYGRSLIVLVALAWAVLAVIKSVLHSEWLFEQAYTRNVKAWHYWPLWALLLMAVLGAGASLWFFGRHEAAYLVSDLLHLTILLAVAGGLTYFAAGTGGHLKKGAGKVGFAVLGASHALLQIAVPFLLVRKGHLVWAVAAALLAAAAFKYVGRRLARMESGWPLAAGWAIFGAILLAIPFVFNTSPPSSVYTAAGSLNIPAGAWAKLALCLYAGAIGAVMSCVLFGSYLAVSLAFNGHNNEAGGAARIEGFKHFIRFRINREGLTGYVIAIDRAEGEGGPGKLRPKVVDVFHVREG
ncbi:MAG TPA: hypothetical protein VK421_18745 [Pyrinomonadaceae bacterium]|nr:hypothetical protein [Pyrinomonadaceae bacterium]